MDDHDALLIALLTVFVVLLVIIVGFIIVWYFRRQRRGVHLQAFSASDQTPLLPSLSRPRIERAQAQENASLLTCHFYIRTTGEYTFHSQLTQIGSDPEKNWFLITPISKTSTITLNTASHLLSLQPKSDRLTQLVDEESTAAYVRTLNNLFSRLHHPYVEPLLKLDILYTQKLVIKVKRYQRLGSLKDVLHGVVPTANFHGKYSYRSSGLALNRVRLYSCQLLEGLLFLQSKSIPPITDLHSGNVVVSGSCVQIGSYEYQFLEQRSRIYPLTKRAVSSLILPEGMTKAQASEVFCYGALVFEMLTGYELGEHLRGLTPKHWHDCGRDPDARQMLTRLFDISQPVLTLTELRDFPYIANNMAKLKELQDFSVMPGEYSNDVKILLEQWTGTMRRKRNSTVRTSTLDRRKSTTTSRPAETSIINLSYSPSIPPTTPTTPKSNLPGPTTSSASPTPPPASPAPKQPTPTPPPPPAPSAQSSGDSGDRSALLDNIRQGTTLRKAVTNDRSAPKFK
ncbi:unnamed protein product [Adineta ricciae]|uniref:WH2 domain-containing protein n=1 Tax=Adineta ricciae TaxID=249248 RepID=A0A814W7U7_ADIRI|nr:unnamed protein product [Adineta ricciae]